MDAEQIEGIDQRQFSLPLQADEEGKLQAKPVLAEMERKHPGRFEAGQVRTLQCRMRT